MSFLKVSGNKIVNEQGEEVVLKGAGLGGWMNMENFISGFPGCEYQIREALADAIGKEKSEFFFDKFLEYFFTEADAKYYTSLGLNCIRLPFNYRHFEDDMNPRVLKKEGFKHLDRVVDICAKHGIYTILDLHTTPGGQNTDWHSDHGGHIANFWNHKDFQDRTVWLWGELAQHYASNPWIAGLNPMNEPTCPPDKDGIPRRLLNHYNDLVDVIRKYDDKHVIFFDGNTFASSFDGFGESYARWGDNVAYAIHDYSLFGFPSSPEAYTSTDLQKHRLKRSYEKKRAWMDEHGLCVWNGEWGPVYARKEFEGDSWEQINEERYRVLKDQLEIYANDSCSWSIWLYKDIGFQGMTHLDPNTPYMKLLNSTGFLQKKYRLACDAWGATTDQPHLHKVFDPLVDLITENIPEKYRNLYPYPVWKFEDRVGRIARIMLISEFLVKEWADLFVGRDSFEELDALAGSWKLENSLKRDGLTKVLRDAAGLKD